MVLHSTSFAFAERSNATKYVQLGTRNHNLHNNDLSVPRHDMHVIYYNVGTLFESVIVLVTVHSIHPDLMEWYPCHA